MEGASKASLPDCYRLMVRETETEKLILSLYYITWYASCLQTASSYPSKTCCTHSSCRSILLFVHLVILQMALLCQQENFFFWCIQHSQLNNVRGRGQQQAICTHVTYAKYKTVIQKHNAPLLLLINDEQTCITIRAFHRFCLI